MSTVALANPVSRIRSFAASLSREWWVALCAVAVAAVGTMVSLQGGAIIAYGDAESHLNIAKRVVGGLTPGLAQLGGIWLPLPHLLLVPFVYFDQLWRTGLAGSIVSGAAFVVSAVYVYKLTFLLTRHSGGALFAAAVFMANPNAVYMQSTPMTELVLIAFFLLSSYHFIRYLYDRDRLSDLVFAAFFGFCASLSRYDGWALVLMEAGILFLALFPWKANAEGFRRRWSELEGRIIVFSTLAFFGILLWLVWGWLILGDALYFTHSEFSAKSQQNSWYERGELPSYRDLPSSLLYYSVTSMANVGLFPTAIGLVGLAAFAFDRHVRHRAFVLLVLAVPFLFNVATLYLGQSVIFIPSLTPESFEWNLFNVRYGLMMVPFMAVTAGYLFYRLSLLRIRTVALAAASGLLVSQLAFYATGRAQIITLEDGTSGLSSLRSRNPDAERYFRESYDYGKLLTDDFSRAISIVKSPVRMEDAIYIGNKPYWEESLAQPERHARWIIMQKDDPLWKSMLLDPTVEARLYTYFNRVYTSDEVLIFRRIDE